jgi:hypothetical protein
MINQQQLVKLLGRDLTQTEIDNFNLYMGMALSSVSGLLCIDLCDEGGTRTYRSRDGYRELWIDPFSNVNTVSIDGVETTDYATKQNNSYNGEWYNVLEFDEKLDGSLVTVDASWGFSDCMPSDLQTLVAKMFDYNSSTQGVNQNVKSKKIEDYSVTYKDSDPLQDFLEANRMLVNKYGQCNLSEVSHGTILRVSDDPLYFSEA